MSAGDLLMSGDETEQEPVEQRRGAVVDGRETVRVERSPASDDAELGQERPASRDEQRDRLGQRDCGRGESPSEVVPSSPFFV